MPVTLGSRTSTALTWFVVGGTRAKTSSLLLVCEPRALWEAMTLKHSGPHTSCPYPPSLPPCLCTSFESQCRWIAAKAGSGGCRTSRQHRCSTQWWQQLMHTWLYGLQSLQGTVVRSLSHDVRRVSPTTQTRHVDCSPCWPSAEHLRLVCYTQLYRQVRLMRTNVLLSDLQRPIVWAVQQSIRWSGITGNHLKADSLHCVEGPYAFRTLGTWTCA